MIGRPSEGAEGLLRKVGFKVKVKIFATLGQRGVVRDQSPLPPRTLPKGRTVTIKVGALGANADVCATPGGLITFGDYPYHAGGIEVVGVACATARALIQDAHGIGSCRAADCNVDGYSCRTEDAGTQAVAVTCVNGPDRVGWTWSGGY